MTFGPDNRIALTVFPTPPADVYPIPALYRTRVAVATGDATTGLVTRRAELLPGASAPFFLNGQLAFAAQDDRNDPITLYRITSDSGGVRLSVLPARAEYVIAGMNSTAVGEAYDDGLPVP